MSEHMAPTHSNYPGYPTERLIVTNLESLDNMTLPDGKWSASISVFPTLDEQKQLKSDGYELDNFGRPLHPWLREMLTNPEVGVVTGLGEYWHWGPNKTGDPIVIGDGKILLVKRSDTGNWALPGGFVNDGETGHQAAKRELFEETGILVASDGTEIYDGPVADSRATAHAWPETTAVIWHVGSHPNPTPNDDAVDARWFAIDELPDNLHGSHFELIQTAIERLGETPVVSAYSLPEKTRSYRVAQGGHMAYNRFFITIDDGEIFVKSHDKQAFTDTFREERSKKYLQKENHIYQHVAVYHPTILPHSVRMVEDHSIVMQALTAEDGWQWRAPAGDFDRYVQDVMEHLKQLQMIPLPDEKFHSHMNPTYDTHKIEGWDTINDLSLAAIIAKMHEFHPKLRPDFQATALNMANSLPTLAYDAMAIVEPDELFFCHHDFRPANLAWHPTEGTRIVDWSWAGAGRQNSDATTLLIDLHKSGHSIQKYMNHFNPDHALTLIGFWLAHSLWPTRTNDQSVRFHQVASAISAYDLLMKHRER